jgi:hypothetical protein
MTAIPEIDALLTEFFQAVSFVNGQPPQYRNLWSLFLPSGQLIKASEVTPEITSLDQFIASRQQLVDAHLLTDFHEAELSCTLEVFGHIAHRLSVYQKSGTREGVPFTGQGKISTQFIYTPEGWKISSMIWDDERPGLTIEA